MEDITFMDYKIQYCWYITFCQKWPTDQCSPCKKKPCRFFKKLEIDKRILKNKNPRIANFQKEYSW